ncbi:54S ribosomal protein img2, mitochondrial [Saitoella coloradoensis]
MLRTIRPVFASSRPFSTSLVQRNAPVVPTPEPVPESEVKLVQYPYYVRRTASNQIPVYSDYKRGGNLLQTLIRKIEGDHQALLAEVQEKFNIDKKDIKINPVTKHIVIKGHYTGAIKAWLQRKGF